MFVLCECHSSSSTSVSDVAGVIEQQPHASTSTYNAASDEGFDVILQRVRDDYNEVQPRTFGYAKVQWESLQGETGSTGK